MLTSSNNAGIRRLEELTGRDLARPVDCAEVSIALRIGRILGLPREHPAHLPELGNRLEP
jgi:hypothetical protein